MSDVSNLIAYILSHQAVITLADNLPAMVPGEGIEPSRRFRTRGV